MKINQENKVNGYLCANCGSQLNDKMALISLNGQCFCDLCVDTYSFECDPDLGIVALDK